MKVRHGVFWPPFLLIVTAVGLSLYDDKTFVAVNNAVNGWILGHFSSAFVWAGLLSLLTCAFVCFSPLGHVRLGGEGAKPLLKPLDWIAVALGINTAVGILFWATAEPIYHLTQPPASLGLAASSPEARTFALSTLYMHWAFTPCALYTLPAVIFAFAFYNMKAPFSLLACLAPLTNGRPCRRLGQVLDSICLFSLLTGMAASLGTGILTLAGGLEHSFGMPSDDSTYVLVGGVIVVTFLASSISGLDRGIKWLSLINLKLFIALAALAVAFGPASLMWQWGSEAITEYTSTFWARSLLTEFSPGDPWPNSWTVFYYAVWLAWAPMTAIFMGRIGRGYTVRQFLVVNLLIPSVFAVVWMTIFGSTSLEIEAANQSMSKLLAERGPEALIFAVFQSYPYAKWIIGGFLFTAFISYVTSADSNTTVMAGITSVGICPECPEPGVALKVIWGALLGAISVIMLCHSGVDGIRTLSYLGGLPALLFEIAAMISLWAVAWNPAKYSKTEIVPEPEAIEFPEPVPT